MNKRKLQLLFGGSKSFNPSELLNLWAWFDASEITGLSDTDPLTTWNDISGNSRNASQATAEQKPTYSVNQLNGLPVVSFAGGAVLLSTAAFASRLPQPYSIICVAKIGAAEAAQGLFDGLTGDYRGHVYKVGESATGALKQYCTPTEYEVKIPVTHGSYHIDSVVFNGASSAYYRDGALFGFGTTGTADIDGLYLGNTYAWNSGLVGGIAELLLCESLSDVDRVKIEKYLSKKYGISL